MFEAFGPRWEVGFVILYMQDLGQRGKLISNQVIENVQMALIRQFLGKYFVLKHPECGSVQSLCKKTKTNRKRNWKKL